MATILKIYDEDLDTSMEVFPFDENKLLRIGIQEGVEDDALGVYLDEQEVEELIEYLHKRLKEMF